MRAFFLLLALLLPACRDQHAPVPPTAELGNESSCRREYFEQSSFTVCLESGGQIEVRAGKRSFAALGLAPTRVAFAMNAGMFDEKGSPIGLLIEDGRELHSINRRKGGGNFHLLPNGVFIVHRNGRSEVIETKAYKPSPNIRFATQSGPMLVIDGRLHPRFDRDGQSRYVRNGVGVAPDGTATFVISDEMVSFGKFARFFRDRVKARNALYLDGSVSSLWDPAAGRQDSFTELGPIVVVFRKEATR